MFSGVRKGRKKIYPSAPDTLDVEEFSFDSVGGNYALLQDVTSDGIVDLSLACYDQTWHIYVGLSGKRLSEVYGTGNDLADPEHGYPDARPLWRLAENGFRRAF